MSEEFYETSKAILKIYLGVSESNKVLIVCDEGRLRIADALAVTADTLGAIPAIMVITKRFRKTKTVKEGILSKGIEHAIREMDIIILCLANIQMELEFRRRFIREIRRSPVRVANLPGITENAFKKIRGAPKLKEIERIGNDVARLLANGRKARVTSPLGTNIEFELYGWKVPPEISSGYLLQPSTWGNLPGAEIYIAPKAWSANGKIVIDLTIDQDHRVTSPISFEVEKGRVRTGSIESNDTKAVRLLTKTLKRRNGDALCEFGIGLNRRIKGPTGITLIDEKIFRTAHFALGDNIEFGGEIESRVHYDMVFSKPSVSVDNSQIMKDGMFTYSERDLLNNYRYFEGTIPNTAIVRSTPWSTCVRIDGGLAQLWRGGTGRMHAFILGNKETSEAAEKIWTAISHRGSLVAQISRKTGISLEKVKKVIEFMAFHRILEVETQRNDELERLSKKSQTEEKFDLL